MGQKVNPTGIRLGIVTDWTSKWYASSKNFPDLLETDLKVRQFLKKKLANASVSRIQIERPARLARITMHTARPGVVIGKKGEDIEALRKAVARMMGWTSRICRSTSRRSASRNWTRNWWPKASPSSWSGASCSGGR